MFSFFPSRLKPMSSAMNLEPPSPSKAKLIGEFLRLTGIQAKIDEGGFFDRCCGPGGLVFAALPPDTLYGDASKIARAAVRTAYAPHRSTWQSEYEQHVNWEFEEAELGEIVSFLASPAGEHYREGMWRMNAYIGTNTEHLSEEIVREACVLASGRRAT